MFLEQQISIIIRIISEGSCDTEYNDAEKSALHHINK